MNFSEIAGQNAKSMVAKAPLDQVQPELEAFEQQLLDGMDTLWNEQNFAQYLEKLAELAPGIMMFGMDLAERGAMQIGELKPKVDDWSNAKTGFFFSYCWPESLKPLMTLWREILVEGNHALILNNDKQVDLTALRALQERSLNSLKEYWQELKKKLLEKEGQLTRTPEPFIEQWYHQHNPWPAFENQLQGLGEQIVEQKVQQGVLAQAGKAFDTIYQLIRETLFLCEAQLEKVLDHGKATVKYIQENEDEKPAILKAKINETQQAINFQHRLDHFLSQLETHIDNLPERVNVVLRNGEHLTKKEIPFRKMSRQWLESELLPQFYEFWEIIDRANNGMKVALLNIVNRVSVIEKETTDEAEVNNAPQSLNQPLLLFLENSQQRTERLSALQSYIEGLLMDEFRVSKVYDPENYFLPNATGINQLRLNQNEVWQGISNWWNKGRDAIKRLRSSVEQEETLSVSEKIARAIEQRTGNPQNIQYNNIFLTKGYLGESFVVGREQEFSHIKKLIDQWQAGFRGAVLLYGSRFCGKTLFGEMVANKYFHRKTIRLEPNAFLQIDGRRFTTKYDLHEALEFIKKYTLNQRPLIWIDDLELWSDPSFPLGKNIRALEKFISDHSGRLFFMVSTSTELKTHLKKAYNMEHSFQAVMSLDQMTMHEIKEAILIRHGATHKKLVTPEGGVVSPGQFKKMSERIIKQAKGNIGEAFFKWSMHVDMVDDERVSFIDRRFYYLPPFLNADNGILLAAIHMEKLTNEYRLRKIFGPSFKDRYSAILQRLLRTKVLVRKSNGWLSINDLLVNELVEMMIEETYLMN